MSVTKIVKDAHKWSDMAGDTPLEKMVNSYLTTQFTVPSDVPADECLSEARKIIEAVRDYYFADGKAPFDEK